MQQSQIYREFAPAVDLAESRKHHSWEWVCSSLVNKDKGDCAVDIIDTIFVQRGQLTSWFYTNNGGIIRKKSQRKLTLESVYQEFTALGTSYEKNTQRFACVAWSEDSKRLQLITAQELVFFLDNLHKVESVSLSAYLHPRGDLDPTRFGNFEHEFCLNKSGKPQTKLFKLAMGNQKIPSMDSRLNSIITDQVQIIVNFLEKTRRCKIVRFVSYFLVDDLGRLYFWRTDSCETINTNTSNGGATGKNLLSTKAYDGPSAVNERLLARARNEATRMPDEELIQAILSSPTPQPKKVQSLASNAATTSSVNGTSLAAFDEEFFRQSALKSRRASREALLGSITSTPGLGGFPDDMLPASSGISRQRQRAVSAAHLISSQKRGCCGDYCNMTISTSTMNRLEVDSDQALHTQLLKRSKTIKGGGALASATAAAAAFLGENGSGKTRKASLHHVAEHQEEVSEEQQRDNKRKQSTPTSRTIPFKLIAQARAEKSLVDLFIRRYQNGEDCEYLAEAYYGEGEPLGQNFPGYYYQDVQICENCFNFYMLIEDVRMKALQKIGKQKKAKRNNSLLVGRPREFLRDGDDQEISSLELFRKTNDENVWRRVWEHAIAVASNFSKREAAELISFSTPHPAVSMVVGALSILLVGREVNDWQEAKRVFTQDKLLSLLHGFDIDRVSVQQIIKASAHARNPLFTSGNISPISSIAGKLCDWILCALQAYAWKNGVLLQDANTRRILCFLKQELLPQSYVRKQAEELQQPLGVYPKVMPSLHSSNLSSISSDISYTTLNSTSNSTFSELPSTKGGLKYSQKEARKAIQEQQMSRLAASTGAGLDASVGTGSEIVFTCQDGVTKIPYCVIGQAVGESTKCNLIVFQDFFDTMDSTKVFFRPIVAKHVGCRVLFFNLPGQAGSSYPLTDISTASTNTSASQGNTNSNVFNNVWMARKVHELLVYLQNSKRFLTSGLPFHIVGFGNGGNLATCFSILFGKLFYEQSLQSLVLLNGFAKVDSQLAAILHSTLNVYSCFPPSRPDLPVSFFSKFLFSESYLSKIDPNLALSIYTAVTNPISLDGRIRICRGALHHIDLTNQLLEIEVPLVVVQSVENALIAPTNVDVFLEGRAKINHVWSHQQSPSGEFNWKTKKQLQQVLETPKSAFVTWLRAGHEIRQESKKHLIELFELLVNFGRSSSASTGGTAQDGSVASCHGEGFNEQISTDSRLLSSIPIKTAPAVSMEFEEGNEEAFKAQKQTDVLEPTVTSSSLKMAREAPTNVLSVQLEQSERAFENAVQAHQRQLAEERIKRKLQLQEQQQQQKQPSPKKVQYSVVEVEKDISHKLHTTATESTTQKPVPSSTNASPRVTFDTNSEVSRRSVPPVVNNPLPPTVVAVAEPNLKINPSLASPGITSASLAVSSSPVVVSPVLAALNKQDQAERAAMAKEIESIRQKMEQQEQKMEKQAEELKLRQKIAVEEQMESLRAEQERRRRLWEAEDNARLAELERKLQQEQQERILATKQRDKELLVQDATMLLSSSIITPVDASLQVSAGYSPPKSKPTTLENIKENIRSDPEFPSLFDEMEKEERNKKRNGFLLVDEYENIKQEVHHSHFDKVREREKMLKEQQNQKKRYSAVTIQKYVRMFLAMCHYKKLLHEHRMNRLRIHSAKEIQRVARGFIGRRRALSIRRNNEWDRLQSYSATMIQKTIRGFLCRCQFEVKYRNYKANQIQRVYRGLQGRKKTQAKRDHIEKYKSLHVKATKIQATWRMYAQRDKYQTLRFANLAAIEIQRTYRGHLGRQDFTRKKQWKEAEPGPEKIALGLKMIESSKQAFERQQHEIDALHRAQEKVELQVSTIHSELQESEKELALLEKELQEIDQLETDLYELTHEAEMARATAGVEKIVEGNRTGANKKKIVGSGVPPLGSGIPNASKAAYEVGMEDLFENKEEIRKRQAEMHALEMAIQIKKAEREKKKKDLEIEFTSVFQEVQQKRQALAQMEEKLADMEATRMRKDREFARLQRNLMELLEEQKLELENLREKGIELETATATSAAAAAATAMKAKEHEKRSQAMFESTEELMKFQFMSMSLSYFSSLNMLKNLRDINADTTAAAITSTAETAAAAAAAAAAANIPTMKRMQVGGTELMTTAAKLKQEELSLKQKQEEEAKKGLQQPLPEQIKDWTVDDVGRWLDTLSLSQYKSAFKEGAVDGEFLLELRAEDMMEVLGVSHKLHVRKIVVARNKLLPLNQQEQMQLETVEYETGASGNRRLADIPDIDTAFSQARNGRLKRLTESIDAGFDVNSEDDKGNTLLLIACQNVNIKMVEYLISKGANVNHKNVQGNTPLHFAMAYDTEGTLGEYLIGHGADDTIENNFGLSPYDGLQPENT